jgi:hypothetical protein
MERNYAEIGINYTAKKFCSLCPDRFSTLFPLQLEVKLLKKKKKRECSLKTFYNYLMITLQPPYDHNAIII